MTATKSRRAILAGATAFATGTAANAGAIAFACAEPNPDVELVAIA